MQSMHPTTELCFFLDLPGAMVPSTTPGCFLWKPTAQACSCVRTEPQGSECAAKWEEAEFTQGLVLISQAFFLEIDVYSVT